MEIKLSKNSLFDKWCWNLDIHRLKNMNLNTGPTLFTIIKLKINHRLIQNTKSPIRELKEILNDLGYGYDYWDITPKTCSMKHKFNKLDLFEIKNFSEKDNVKRIRRQATDWEKKNVCKRHLIKDCFQNVQ